MAKKTTVKQRKNSEAQKRRLANLTPFKKGQSGNPAGRPKSVTLSEAYRQALAQPFPGDPQGRTHAEVIADVVVTAAAKGDVGSAKELADRTEGRPRQMLDVDMNLRDWRAMAQANGLNEADVLLEARRLIESADDGSGSEPNS